MNRTIITLTLAVAFITAPGMPVLAAPPQQPPAALLAAAQQKDDDRLAELRERFKKRHPQIQKFKGQGVVGETSEGYLDFVDQRVKEAIKLIEAENLDRKALYIILAEEEGVDVVIVATRSAKRAFERARPGEFLREGKEWRKKE